ncbi:MAG: DMT family transporter [Bacteroidales bacterium]|nr:DMT family transporter [Bacteroidales bacterium]
MFENNIGELAALSTAFFWTFTAIAFESAGKKVGSLSVNLIRLIIGLLFLSVFTLFYRGFLLPIDASSEIWLWLLLSGLVGFVFGDLCLFQAYVLIGSRISMLFMSLAPPITAILGWIILGEKMSIMNIAGMAIVITGILLVVIRKNKSDNPTQHESTKKNTIAGILLALGGASGQALGLVLSKKGMGDYNPFAATQIRIIAGVVGFAVVLTIFKRWSYFKSALKNRRAMTSITIGSFFGPFLGVSFSLIAIQYANTGVAATIMSIVPVLIIPFSIKIFKERVALKEIIGAIIAVTGVLVFFI